MLLLLNNLIQTVHKHIHISGILPVIQLWLILQFMYAYFAEWNIIIQQYMVNQNRGKEYKV